MSITAEQLTRMLRHEPEDHENDPVYALRLLEVSAIAFWVWAWDVCMLMRWWAE